MFIQTETTPNPNTLKFLPGKTVLESGTKFYTSNATAEESPLALSLFQIAGVNAIFLGSDFVTVTKAETFDWSVMKADLLTCMMDFFVAGHPIIHSRKAKMTAESSEEDSQIVKEIKEMIDMRVRPAVAQDGGDIVFHSFKDGVVYLEMHGSCAGCPSSTLTLKQGIENMLKHYIPEVIAVEAA
jgi:Fe-S cluster biogenesis protein NfuA